MARSPLEIRARPARNAKIPDTRRKAVIGGGIVRKMIGCCVGGAKLIPTIMARIVATPYNVLRQRFADLR
jgi:hypothetical protein